MKNNNYKKLIVVFLLIVFAISSCIPAFGTQIETLKTKETKFVTTYSETKYIEIELSFSDPEVVNHNGYWIARVTETNHNRYVLFDMDPGKPVLPVNISIYELMFGSKIIDVNYEHSTPGIIDLPGTLAYCRAKYDIIGDTWEIPNDKRIYEGTEPYPSDWVLYHTGGGLSFGEHTTFLSFRVYPVRFYPAENQLHYINTISVNISYQEPEEPILEDNDIYDLLIIGPAIFKRQLQPLIKHKNKYGMRTEFASTLDIYLSIKGGRDKAEKIKYFIKKEIEESGIKYVLLAGGRMGQFFRWNIPVRYSKVVPPDEQEYPEKSFLSDLYFADIYDGEGIFSSWDSNNDDEYSVWNATFREEMDLYPDVYLGRIPCRNTYEVKVMVDKIIDYENGICDEGWFKNLILVAGDSYNDSQYNTSYNEGELISEKAIELMPEFTPVRLYARDGQDINRKTVNNVMNKGGGFAYFCGHGSAGSWSTHFPPDGVNWTTGYDVYDMVFLRNKEKLPITVVGGCHNGQFDVTLLNFLNKNAGLGEWLLKCWSWWFTDKNGGGAIATISNTGLGTHGDGDHDNNTIPDYLEILDGWLELRFLELYGSEGKDVLGENHGETLTGYLNKFYGDDALMDTKMVQQWELFGDPSMKIGGYDEIVLTKK